MSLTVVADLGVPAVHLVEVPRRDRDEVGPSEVGTIDSKSDLDDAWHAVESDDPGPDVGTPNNSPGPVPESDSDGFGSPPATPEAADFGMPPPSSESQSPCLLWPIMSPYSDYCGGTPPASHAPSSFPPDNCDGPRMANDFSDFSNFSDSPMVDLTLGGTSPLEEGDAIFMPIDPGSVPCPLAPEGDTPFTDSFPLHLKVPIGPPIEYGPDNPFLTFTDEEKSVPPIPVNELGFDNNVIHVHGGCPKCRFARLGCGACNPDRPRRVYKRKASTVMKKPAKKQIGPGPLPKVAPKPKVMKKPATVMKKPAAAAAAVSSDSDSSDATSEPINELPADIDADESSDEEALTPSTTTSY